jgi:tetratricopeptide (TPR) repeat protein
MVRLGAALVLALVCFAGVAYADGGKSEFEKALKYSRAGEYEAALPLFQRAYELSKHRPSTILALAQCERELKMYDEAIQHFREYLGATPPPKDAPKIQETIALLEDIRAEEKARAEKAALAEAQKPVLSIEPAPPKKVEEPPKLAAQPAKDPDPKLVVTTQPPDDDDTIFESPIFWIVTGVVVVGGAIGAGIALSGTKEAYGGTTDAIL